VHGHENRSSNCRCKMHPEQVALQESASTLGVSRGLRTLGMAAHDFKGYGKTRFYKPLPKSQSTLGSQGYQSRFRPMGTKIELWQDMAILQVVALEEARYNLVLF